MVRGGKKKIGEWGENLACAFLCRRGFKIIERNYYTTVGEIDIVAKLGDDFYFVEVKTRRAGEMANDLAITAEKWRRFEKTVGRYCCKHQIEGGIILAALIVAFDRVDGTVHFSLIPKY